MKPLSQHIHESFQDTKEVKETIVENLNEDIATEETATENAEIIEETETSKEE